MIGVTVLLVSLPFLVVTGLKGKWGVAALGVLFWPAAVVGALRLAKPDSWWARRRYDGERRARAEAVLPRRRRQAAVAAAAILPAVLFVLVALKAYRVPTEAMDPTLRPSDRVVALRSFFAGSPDAGDVVAYRMPAAGVAECGSSGTYVHRVSARRSPPGRVFVAGDNPAASCDSRVFGPIPEDAVEAQVLFRYWPLDRIGRVE